MNIDYEQLTKSILANPAVQKAIAKAIEDAMTGEKPAAKKFVKGKKVVHPSLPIDDLVPPEEKVAIVVDYTPSSCALVIDFRKPAFEPFKEPFLDGMKPRKLLFKSKQQLSIPADGAWLITKKAQDKAVEELTKLGIKHELFSKDAYIESIGEEGQAPKEQPAKKEVAKKTIKGKATKAEPKEDPPPPKEPLSILMSTKRDLKYKTNIIFNGPQAGKDFVVSNFPELGGTLVVGVQRRDVDPDITSPLRTVRALTPKDIAALKGIEYINPDDIPQIHNDKARKALIEVYSLE